VHSPSEVVRLARDAGIGILSLTDHDTTAGLAEAASAARAEGVEFVPGIEISCALGDEDVHLLGYFIGDSDELDEYVAMMRERRVTRLEDIVRRLRAVGVEVDAATVRSYANRVVTRAHIARFLVDTGRVGTVHEAFARYLGPGCAAYVPSGVITPQEAIAMIHRAGGCTSLAHPGEWIRESAVESMIRAGLDAIEVVHPSHDDRLTQYYGELASERGLCRTGGSDLHATSAEGRSAMGAFWVSAEDVRSLRERRPTLTDRRHT
jgi:predicted metal-dependent phosphoesterase TrpH